MKLKIISSFVMSALVFSTVAKAESYCTQSEKTTLELLNGKGSLSITNIYTRETRRIGITSFDPTNLPPEASNDSLWNQPVVKTEASLFEGAEENSPELHTGGMIKIYLQNGDVALLFVGAELEYKNFGTQKSCK